MPSNTSHYGLEKLGPAEQFAADGYRFTQADRDQIDRGIYQGVQGHHHDGAGVAIASPTQAPSLTLATTGGTIPAATRVYYRFTYVDGLGCESAVSPEAYVDTASPVSAPLAPTLSTAISGGSLQPGAYYYVLSAYVGANTSETRAENPNYLTIPVGTVTNTVTLTMPTLPSGAAGFNVYRKRPNAAMYAYLASTTGSSYVDDGSVTEDVNRTSPTADTTSATNKITVTLPGATPVLPAGVTWKIYRAYEQNNYDNSLLHWVVEQTVPGTTDVSYVDVGLATVTGKYPVVSQMFASPQPVNLGTEVTGTLSSDNYDRGPAARLYLASNYR